MSRWELFNKSNTLKAGADPVVPGFGYPLIDYKMNPLQEYTSGARKITTFAELDLAKLRIADFEHNQCAHNWRRATKARSAMRLQIYQRLQLENAFETIATSFTHGAKI